MEELNVAAILSVEDEPEVAESREQYCRSFATSSIQEVSHEVIEEACNILLSDPCLKDDIKETIRSVDGEALLSALKFLNQCIVKKGRFPNASKEEAYKTFHQEVQRNRVAVAQVTQVTSQPSAMWICRKAFEVLVRKNYDNPTLQSQSESSDVPQEEVDIVEYIGGFVIHSIKKKANKTADADEKANMLCCLTKLTIQDDEVAESNISTASTSTSAPQSLTRLLDRGGLTQIKPDVVQVFVSLESIFRECFTGETQAFSFDLYFSRCCESGCVANCLHELLYSVDVPEQTKEKLLHEIVKSYFKVRAHHECRSYMDRHRFKTNTLKKQKGLRKALKLAGTSSSQ